MVQFRKGRKSPWTVQWRDHRGQVHTASFRTKDLAEAKERLVSDMRKARRHGIALPDDGTLFIDFARTWMQLRAHSRKAGTINQDSAKLRKTWLPLFGDLPLTSIQTSDIIAELDRLQTEEGISPATRNRHRALLHKLFKDAVIRDKVQWNPVSKIQLVKEIKTRKGKAIKDPEHQRLYIEGMYEEGPNQGILSMLLLWTGARVCSANVFQWRDLDEERGVIFIRRQEDRAAKKIFERQKDSQENADEDELTIVPILPVLRQALAEHRRISPYKKPSDFIACKPNGNFMEYDYIKDVHARVLAAKKLPHFTFHDLRRTFSTNAKKAGITRSELREMLGHSSDIVTARYDIKDIEHLVEKAKRVGFGALPKNIKRIGGRK